MLIYEISKKIKKFKMEKLNSGKKTNLGTQLKNICNATGI